MKRSIAVLSLLFLGAYILYQNQGRIFLILLSQHRLSNPFQLAKTTAASGTPPTYKDGTYTGATADAFYGTIQVKATIQNGKIADVQFLQYPNDRMRSIAINTVAMPNLKQEAIQAQSANVNVVSGATDSSNAFKQSLADALNQAK